MIAKFVLTGLLAFVSLSSAATVWTAGLLPNSGDVSAPAGGTAGWGYTITNEDTALWLVPFDLSADTFEYGTPNSLFLFPVIAPGATLTVLYGGAQGLYEFTWDSNAPNGSVNLGLFIISADWYTADPSAGGVFSQSGGTQELAYSVTLGAGGQIPEPGTYLLTIAAAGSFVLLRRFRRS